MKSTPEQIRARFDQDVERFSNLATGQSATIDAPLVLDLLTDAAAAVNPVGNAVLDIGCGAGNFTLKLLEKLPGLQVTLVDLSLPMLERALQRLFPLTAAPIRAIQGDIRDVDLGENCFDIILAGAVLHHLRTDAEWEAVYRKLFNCLRPGGTIWVSDLVRHQQADVQSLMWRRYGDYLTHLRDSEYRDHVFAYVDQEDTPQTLQFQLDLLRNVGFATVDVLHKNGPFAAFGAQKDPTR